MAKKRELIERLGEDRARAFQAEKEENGIIKKFSKFFEPEDLEEDFDEAVGETEFRRSRSMGLTPSGEKLVREQRRAEKQLERQMAKAEAEYEAASKQLERAEAEVKKLEAAKAEARALKEKAEAKAKAEAEAREKAEAEAKAKAKAEAEAKAKAKAEAEAEAKARARARARAKREKAEKLSRELVPDGPRKVYKYWSELHECYRATDDVWKADQISNGNWRPVWVYFKAGEIDHVLSEEELEKLI